MRNLFKGCLLQLFNHLLSERLLVRAQPRPPLKCSGVVKYFMALWKHTDRNVIYRLFECGYTNKQVETALGIKSSTVSYWKRKLGFASTHNIYKINSYNWEEIQYWYDLGLPMNAISIKFNIPKSTLCTYVAKGKLKARVSKFIVGEDPGMLYVFSSNLLGKIKIGITNDIDRRYKSICMNVPDAVIEFQKQSTYDIVRQCETTTHILFESYNSPIHKCDGYTEWFDIACLPDVIAYLNGYTY